MSVRVNVQLVRYSCSEAVRTPLERARGRLRASGEALRDCRSEVNHFIACALTVHALICRFRPIHCACRGSHTPKWTTVSLNSRPSSAAIHKTCHAPQNTRTLLYRLEQQQLFSHHNSRVQSSTLPLSQLGKETVTFARIPAHIARVVHHLTRPEVVLDLLQFLSLCLRHEKQHKEYTH